MEKKWFVFYTKSRQEKKVEELLHRAQYDVFLPVHTVVKQWSDRKKKITLPLFNSYIFVNVKEHEIPEVLKTPGVAWSIRLNGKPAILRQEEYELVKRFVASGYFFEAAQAVPDFSQGDKAIIIDGPLRGLQGTVISKSDNHSFFIALEGIEQVIRAEIPRGILKRL